MANNSLLAERLAETRATSEAAMALRTLTELVNDPSGKRFARSRGGRMERWLQIEGVARQQAAGLRALAADKPIELRFPAEVASPAPPSAADPSNSV